MNRDISYEIAPKKKLKSRQVLKNGTNIVLIWDTVQEVNIGTVTRHRGGYRIIEKV